MSDGKLTEAQKRARDWLPADGSWRTDPGRLTAALSSLSIAWPRCVERGVEVKAMAANAR